MRTATALCLVAAAALSPGPAWAYDPTTVAALLAEPSRYDAREVSVEGVAGPAHWAPVTVQGNPPFQDLVQMFLLTDGATGLWVVTSRAGTRFPGGLSAAPAAGTRITVKGIFRAATRAMEMDFLVMR